MSTIRALSIWPTAWTGVSSAWGVRSHWCGTKDADDDGFGDSLTDQISCSQPADRPGGGRLRRHRPARPTAARELCDGIDNDCDGTVDQDDAEAGYDCESGLSECAEGIGDCQTGTSSTTSRRTRRSATAVTTTATAWSTTATRAAEPSVVPGPGTPATRGWSSASSAIFSVCPIQGGAVCDGLDLNCNGVADACAEKVFLQSIGASGTGLGEMKYPTDVAIDAQGNILVANQAGGTVQIFDTNGFYIGQLGSSGSGAGEFEGPTGIAIADSGNIFVTDIGRARVLKFDESGSFLTEWGEFGTEPGQFTSLYGIAVDRFENVFVADVSDERIRDSTPTATSSSSGASTAEAFRWPPSWMWDRTVMCMWRISTTAV